MFQQPTGQIFTIFGYPGTYEAEADFTERDITVLLNGYNTTQEQYPEVWVAEADIDVMVSEVPEPVVGDKITFDGAEYYVAERLSGDAYVWRLALRTDMETL